MKEKGSKLKKTKQRATWILRKVFALEFITRFRLFRMCAKLSELNSRNMNKMAIYSLVKLSIVWAIHAINFFHISVFVERGFYLKMFVDIQRRLGGQSILRNFIIDKEKIVNAFIQALEPYSLEILNMALISTALVIVATIVSYALKNDNIGEKSRLLMSDLVEYGIQTEEREDEESKDSTKKKKLNCLWTPDGVLIESRKSTEKSIREMETFWNSLNRTPGTGVQDPSNRHLYFFPFGFVLENEYKYDYVKERKNLRKMS